MFTPPTACSDTTHHSWLEEHMAEIGLHYPSLYRLMQGSAIPEQPIGGPIKSAHFASDGLPFSISLQLGRLLTYQKNTSELLRFTPPVYSTFGIGILVPSLSLVRFHGSDKYSTRMQIGS